MNERFHLRVTIWDLAVYLGVYAVALACRAAGAGPLGQLQGLEIVLMASSCALLALQVQVIALTIQSGALLQEESPVRHLLLSLLAADSITRLFNVALGPESKWLPAVPGIFSVQSAALPILWGVAMRRDAAYWRLAIAWIAWLSVGAYFELLSRGRDAHGIHDLATFYHVLALSAVVVFVGLAIWSLLLVWQLALDVWSGPKTFSLLCGLAASYIVLDYCV